MTELFNQLRELVPSWKANSDTLHGILSSIVEHSSTSIVLDADGFCTEFPADQNAVNLFAWTSQIPVEGVQSGGMRLFSPEDPRPKLVLDFFGDLSTFEVLELGSFEGAHAYQLDRLGAKSVLGIEANPASFMKSLIAKEVTGMRAKFLLGDFTKYLDAEERRFDLIFCSGVLYHMADPLGLLRRIADRTDRVFIWTHYVTEQQSSGWADSFQQESAGYKCKYYRMYYAPERPDRGYSGVEHYCCRLLQCDIIGAMRSFGFPNTHIVQDDPHHPNGAALSLICTR